MFAVARCVFWLALAVWVGEIVFFSFVVAPTVFGAVPQETAGQIVGAVFPRYYLLGTVAGAIALVAALAIGRAPGATGAWTAITVMLAAMLAATLYAGRVIQPRAQTLRPQLHVAAVDPAVRATFDALHRRAVQLNGAVLLLGIAAICVAATAPTPPR
jgi:uncharacterized membrane protein